MLGNQEIRADEQEDDQGNVRLGLHRTIVVRFTLVFHTTPKGCRRNLAGLRRQPQFRDTPPPVSWSASALSARKYEKVIVSRQHLQTALKKEIGHRPLKPSSQTASERTEGLVSDSED
jgi:hypothetical protein